MYVLQLIFLLSAAIASIDADVYDVVNPTEWWQTTTLYQILPRSFKDSDGDGIGDLNGITSKLDELKDLGIEIIWVSPMFKSPMVDGGYDISDYRDIYPTYGTLEDFDNLVTEAHNRDLKVILDYVPNHTSDEHEWFILSKNNTESYTDYYIWNEGVLDANGTRQPPNNWLSVFNSGSAWEWVEERQAYYLHQFHVKQPDLNFENPQVIQETKDILTFWLDRGIDGFRIDSLPYLIEAASLADEPESGHDSYTSTDYYYLSHIHTKDQPENYEIVQIWKDHIDSYTAAKGDGVKRVMFTEAYANISSVMKYYEYGSDVPFNFFFIKDKDGIDLITLNTAQDFANVIDNWMQNMPANVPANWVLGNHDNSRVATRYGSVSVDALNCALFLLPGIATIYNGDELGMTDTSLTWEETTDPQACSTDPSRYQFFSRDPERTPYQWDNTTSAGYSTNSTTMLPVNSNYLTLNRAAQKEARTSHYKNVQTAIALRDTEVIKRGSLNVQVLNDEVVAISRVLEGQNSILVLLNWKNDASSNVNFNDIPNLSESLEVLIADINSDINVGDIFENTIELPANAAVVLSGMSKYKHFIVDHKWNLDSHNNSGSNVLNLPRDQILRDVARPLFRN